MDDNGIQSRKNVWILVLGKRGRLVFGNGRIYYIVYSKMFSTLYPFFFSILRRFPFLKGRNLLMKVSNIIIVRLRYLTFIKR